MHTKRSGLNVTYEIISLLGDYTLDAPDRRSAAAVCLLLGAGDYGLRERGNPGARGVPVMVLWRRDDIAGWWSGEFGGTLDQYVSEHRMEVARVAGSVCGEGPTGRIDAVAAELVECLQGGGSASSRAGGT